MGKKIAGVRPKSDELRERAARVLFAAGFVTDVEAGTRYGVCERTVRYYRRWMETDPLLAGLVAMKRREFERAWREKLPVTPGVVADALDEIARSLREGRAGAPEAVESLARSLRAAARVLPDASSRLVSSGDRRRDPAADKW